MQQLLHLCHGMSNYAEIGPAQPQLVQLSHSLSSYPMVGPALMSSQKQTQSSINVCCFPISYSLFYAFHKYPLSDYLTLCMLDNFSCCCCRLLTFFKINFFRNTISVKWFGSRIGPTICWSSFGSKLFAKAKVTTSKERVQKI